MACDGGVLVVVHAECYTVWGLGCDAYIVLIAEVGVKAELKVATGLALIRLWVNSLCRLIVVTYMEMPYDAPIRGNKEDAA